MVLQDKTSIIQVLGNLLKQPSLLSETDKYQLENSDFPERFHKVIFAAINNLFQNGVTEIDEIEIDGFLSQHNIQYEIFNQNKGIEYLQSIQELSKESNFEYYYERLKKFSLIREMDGLGFDISEVYDETLMNPREREELQKKFDEMSISEILMIYDAKLLEVKEKFESDSDAKGVHASDGIHELLDRLEESPDIGLPMNSEMLTSILRGSRRKKFYLKSSISGGGKTRGMVSDSLKLSALGWYDSEKKEWVRNEFNESCVVISTEMLVEELQTIALAYIADVEEHKILQGLMTDEEKERVRHAANILEQSNLQFEELPNFNVKDIERTIEKNIIQHNVGYVWFDYLHSSADVFMEASRGSGGVPLSEHQILLLMSNQLKAICNRHGVYLMSATQLNGNWKEAWQKGEPIDFNLIAGSKAIVNKADALMIMLPPSKKELKEIEEILANGFYPRPNQVVHVSKNRGNPHDAVKVFLHINMGTMRSKDLFVTNFSNELIVIDKIVIKNKDKQEQE